MYFLKYSSITLLFGVLFLGASCTPTDMSHKTYEQEYQETREILHGSEDTAPVSTFEGMWLSSDAYDTNEISEHPDFLNRQISLSSWYPLSLAEIAHRISKLTNISIRFSRDLLDMAEEAQPRMTAIQSKDLNNDIATQPLNDAMKMKIPMQFSGTLKELLDRTSERFNVFWRYKKHGVWLYLLDTHAFTVYLPGETKNETEIRGELPRAQGGAGGSSGGQNSTSTTELNSGEHGSFKQYVEGVKVLMSGHKKSSIKELASTNTIIVTDVPDALHRIETFIAEQNRLLTQQVSLKVEIYEVSTQDEDSFDLAWGATLSELANAQGKNIDGILTSAAASITGGHALLLSRNESTLLLKLLSEKTNLSTLTRTSVMSLSNQPVPIQVVDDISYIESKTISNPGSEVIQPLESITPNWITPGFTMTIVPKVLQKGQIMLQSFIEISELLRLREVGGIELPEMTRRTIAQRVVVQSGKTLVLSGFEKVSKSADENGVGSSGFWFLGGGKRKKKTKAILLIMITPTILS